MKKISVNLPERHYSALIEILNEYNDILSHLSYKAKPATKTDIIRYAIEQYYETFCLKENSEK